MNKTIMHIIDSLYKSTIGYATMWKSIKREIPSFGIIFYELALERKGIRKDQAYMIWNDACGRNAAETVALMNEIIKGSILMDTVNAHLAEGRCAPFTDSDRAVRRFSAGGQKEEAHDRAEDRHE